jgi:hypothetical protein
LQVPATYFVDTYGGGIFTNNGKITLVADGWVKEGGGSVFNNGVITTTDDTASNIIDLLDLQGTGKIELSNGGGVTVGGPNLRQDLVVKGGTTLILPSVPKAFLGSVAGKTVTIENGSSLNLGVTNQVGAKVINGGVINTQAVDVAFLDLIFSEISEGGGRVNSVGNITEISKSFTIPANIELTIADGSIMADSIANLGDPYNLTVKGSLILGEADLAPAGNVTIEGSLTMNHANGSITIADDQTLTIVSSSRLSGPGIIAVESVPGGNTISIDGNDEYSFVSTAGLSAANIKAGIQDMRIAAAALKDNIELPANSPYGTGAAGKVVGTTELFVNVTPHSVFPGPIATGSSPLILPASISIAPDNDEGFDVITTGIVDARKITTPAVGFVLTKEADNSLSITGPYNAGSERFGIIEFNSVRLIALAELIGPMLDDTETFHIGVKTQQ